MADSNEFLVNAAVRHQHFLERFKTSQANKFTKFLKDADRRITDTLNKAGNINSRRKLNQTQTQVREVLAGIYGNWGGELTDDLVEFGEAEADFEARSLEKAVVGISVTAPAVEQIKAAALARPFTGKLLKDELKGFTELESKRVDTLIRQGFFEGKTTAQIITDIRGTKANKFKDGALNITDVSAKRITRTAVQHFSNVARQETWQANDDIITGYEWLSTLDSRTSGTCKALDGRIFDIGNGPLPPAHPNCRSTTTPILDDDIVQEDGEGNKRLVDANSSRESSEGETDANETYNSFLKKQPRSFQDEALGPTKAKLFRDGGLSVTKFVDRKFAPLTLEQLRAKHPEAWKKAGLDGSKAPAAVAALPDPKKKPKTDIVKPQGFASADAQTVEWVDKSFTGTEYNAVMGNVPSPKNLAQTKTKGRLDGAYYMRHNQGIHMGRKYKTDTDIGQSIYRHEFGHHVDASIARNIHMPPGRYYSSSGEYLDLMKTDGDQLLDDGKQWFRVVKKKHGFSNRFGAKGIKNAVAHEAVAGERDFLASGLSARDWLDANIPIDGLARDLFNEMDFSGIAPMDRSVGFFAKAAQSGSSSATLQAAYYIFDMLEKKHSSIGNFFDLIGATTGEILSGGHGRAYYNKRSRGGLPTGEAAEAFANLFDANSKKQTLVKRLAREFTPNQFAKVKKIIETGAP